MNWFNILILTVFWLLNAYFTVYTDIPSVKLNAFAWGFITFALMALFSGIYK